MKMDPERSGNGNITMQLEPPPLDKLISFKDPGILFSDNWFALVFEVTVYCVLLRTFKHAKERGTQEVFLLVSAVVGGLGVEFLQQNNHTGYQLWWYHLGIINLLTHQVPAFIPCFVALVYYYTDYMTRNNKLPLVSSSLVNAGLAMLLLFPCLWLAPNLLLILIHFDDPIFYDRILNVPVCQITYLFLLFFHSKHVFVGNFNEIEPHERHFLRYLRCSVQSGMVSAIFSLVEVYLLFMLFALLLKSYPVYGLVFTVCVLCKLAKDELIETNYQGYTITGLLDTIKRKEWLYLMAFFLFLILVPVIVKPENLKSHGERLELGPCDVFQAVSNTSPLNSTRRRYVCPNDTTQFGFDFHCVPEAELMTSEVKKKYTICGAPFPNPPRVVAILLLYSVACLIIFSVVLSFSLKTDKKISECKKVN